MNLLRFPEHWREKKQSHVGSSSSSNRYSLVNRRAEELSERVRWLAGWLQQSVAEQAYRQSRQQMSKLGAGRRAPGSGTRSNSASPVGHLSLTEKSDV